MIFHMIAFFAGFILDIIFGDPHGMPHPVVLVGRVISFLEGRLITGEEKKDLKRGVVLVIFITVMFVFLYMAILVLVYRIDIRAGVLVEAFMTYQLLAAKSLRTESMRVYHALKSSLPDARKALSMIVGRDTQTLDEKGVIKAAVETVAENTSDGVVAPMLYMAVGGPVLGIFYKAVNTLDSMVGYKSEKYLFFGRASARLDDVLNFVPSRISAWFMILAAYADSKIFWGMRTRASLRMPLCDHAGENLYSGRELSGADALRIYRRDRRKHSSPNSAQTESVCAGALGVQLAGDASYFGRMVKKPTIGDDARPVEREDIRRANRLMYGTAFICEAVCVAVMLIVFWLSS